jgi:hypothetical protein
MNKIITLENGLEVEIEDNFRPYEISEKDILKSTTERLSGLISSIIDPVNESFTKLQENVELESAKLTVGVKVGMEGNFFVAKTTGEANFQIELSVRPKK